MQILIRSCNQVTMVFTCMNMDIQFKAVIMDYCIYSQLVCQVYLMRKITVANIDIVGSNDKQTDSRKGILVLIYGLII